MEKKPLRKLTKHHVFMIIYGVLALSAIAVYWIFNDNPVSVLYVMAALWLVLPVGAMVISYAMSAEHGPKGLTRLLPLAFGATMCAVEFLTFSLVKIIEGVEKMPSIALIIVGALASLIGFIFAKQDRVEKERAEKARKKKEAKAAAKSSKKQKKTIVVEKTSLEVAEDDVSPEIIENISEPVAHEDDYNPGVGFIPNENDAVADEAPSCDDFGEEQVECAESDTEISIDVPEESEPVEYAKEAAEPVEETEIVPQKTEETEPEEAEVDEIEESNADEDGIVAEAEEVEQAAEEPAENNAPEGEDAVAVEAEDCDCLDDTDKTEE